MRKWMRVHLMGKSESKSLHSFITGDNSVTMGVTAAPDARVAPVITVMSCFIFPTHLFLSTYVTDS